IAMSVNPGSKIREGINAKIEKSVEDIDPAEPDYKNQYGFCRINIMPANYLTSKLSSRYSSPGDTLLLTPIRINMDGDTVDFDQNQLFEIGVKEGYQSIDILTKEGKRGQYFAEIQQPIRIIIADSLEEDETDFSVKLAVPKDSLVKYIPLPQMCPAPPQIELKREGINIEQEEKTLMCPVINYKENEQVTEAAGTAQQFTIMLGETKYFQLIEMPGCLDFYGNPTPNTYYIKAAKVSETGEPILDAFAVNQDVWGDDPVSIVDETKDGKPAGKRVGVYWEKKWPDFSKNVKIDKETTIKTFNKMNAVKPGLIRLVGRFWSADSTYKVKLSTNTTYNKNIDIEVVKSGKLGNNTVEYKRSALNNKFKVQDVRGNDILIDTLIYKYAGDTGIPPQLFKAQAWKETDISTSYRYEPWEDIKFQLPENFNQYFKNSFDYVVDTTKAEEMGSGKGIPIDHTNLPKVSYPTEPKKIYEMLAESFKSRYWQRGPENTYPKDEEIKKVYDEIKPIIQKDTTLSDSQIKTKALDSLIYCIKNKIDSRLNKFDKIAQTRIMSSYGYFQQTYYNATDFSLHKFRKIAKDYPPEYLNELEHSFKTYIDRLTYYKKPSKIAGQNWVEGFEQRFFDLESKYNSGEKYYEHTVFQLYKELLPQKGDD
ncbi:MAG: hypothetical protein GXX85_04710, partial [Ignavibacteria bacterium]|nr:hypothetical protein [Ignavibacteria bacterium]